MNRCCALAAFALIVALALCAAGCGDSGSRGGQQPDAVVGAWRVYWWPDANATMELYLRQTTEEHVDLLGRHLNGEPLVKGEIVYYQTRAELAAARNAVQSSYGQTPTYVASVLLTNGGIGFLHPFTRAVHVWAGPKLEADQLGHLMMHVVIDEQAQHLDPRWQRFLIEDWLLSIQIASRR